MKLGRRLNLLHVFSICSGAMLSSLFILPGLAFEKAGPGVLVSYIVAGCLAMIGMFSQAELTSAMPKAGGTYFYVTRSMGDAVGAVYGMITWLSLALKSAYELFFIAVALSSLFDIGGVHAMAVSLCGLLILVNLLGVERAGAVQSYMVLGVLVAVGVYLVCGFPLVQGERFHPFMPEGLTGVIATAGYVFISFGGLLKVASVAEEVRNPGKVVPRGMTLSLLVVTSLYLVTIFVTVGVLGGEGLAGSGVPIAEGAEAVMGKYGYYVFIVVGILAIASAANTGVMAASRYPLALARDDLFPNILGEINERFRTPHYSILLTGVLVAAVMFFETDFLIKAASGVLIVTYLFTCLVVIILREGRLQNYQPEFRSPLYPYLQIVGAIGLTALIFEIGLEAILTNAVLIAGGLALYWFFGRIRITREFALMHLIERVTAREMTGHSLETELREIIRERDEILKDRFDHLIEECEVIDLPGETQVDDFFRMAAEKMAGRLDVPADSLYRKFVQREEESSTVLNPYLAIPHVIIEGESEFGILLGRCRDGVVFPKEGEKVHAVFLLVGSRDERPFHLQTLAAIAQVVQDPKFDERWMAARSQQALRDVVLLSKRKRQASPVY